MAKAKNQDNLSFMWSTPPRKHPAILYIVVDRTLSVNYVIPPGQDLDQCCHLIMDTLKQISRYRARVIVWQVSGKKQVCSMRFGNMTEEDRSYFTLFSEELATLRQLYLVLESYTLPV